MGCRWSEVQILSPRPFPPVHILVTNDDGVGAPGIAALRQAMAGLGDLSVVAPVKNRSAASSSLTWDSDIRVHRREANVYAVEGTPTDCVHIALTGCFLPRLPDLIVSGINDGANMGDDTIYSGTVAAAIEGHLFHIPAFAFSMIAKPAQHFATGALVARQVVERFVRARPPGRVPLYNVNIPDIPAEELGAFVHTRLGRRHVAKPATLRGEDAQCLTYRIGEAGEAKDDAPGTDFAALRHNQVSITPLMTDLTDSALLPAVADWLEA